MLLDNLAEFKLGPLIKRLVWPGIYRVLGMARSGGQPGFNLVRTVNFGAEKGGPAAKRERGSVCER